MFDDTNVYVSARLWESAPRSQWVANEMRRDTAQLRENDGGARVTGKIGPFDVGALNIQAGDEMASRSDPTNFTVVRLRRDILRRSHVSGRFSPRPQSIESVRQFSLEGSIDYIVTADERHLETRQNPVTFQTEFESSDRLLFTATDNYELLVRPFTPPGAGFSIPVGATASPTRRSPMSSGSSGAVQLGQQLVRQQPAPAVGVQPRQRAVRRLHRRPRRHRGVAARPGLGPAQPRIRGQVQPAVPVLTPASVPPYRARARRYSRRPEAGVGAARAAVAAAVEVDQGGAR